MHTSRRRLLLAGCALSTSAVFAESKAPVLGLIVPPLTRPVPEEGLIMYPTAVRFIVAGLGLETMTPEGYDKVIDRIGPTAERLAADGAQAIALLGTSLSFYRGAAFNERLTHTMRDATGLPATTMSTAVVEGLRAVGGQRLAVATAYNDEVNDRLRAFLAESGFEVLVVQGLDIEAVEDVDRVTQDSLLEFSAGVRGLAAEADAMLVSCGGFRTLEIIAPLEARCKLPVVSSMPHALRAGVRLLGLSGQVSGFGTLLEMA
jgi:arylmalonate decarboxylase